MFAKYKDLSSFDQVASFLDESIKD